MPEEFACPNCRGQSVTYPDTTEDHARVVCRSCGKVRDVAADVPGLRVSKKATQGRPTNHAPSSVRDRFRTFTATRPGPAS